MKRQKFLCMLIVLAMVFASVAACSSSEEPANSHPSSENEPTSEPIHGNAEESATSESITLQWAVWNIEMVSFYEPLIEAYRAIAPHVTVELVEIGADNWNENILTLLIGGHDYDIISVRDNPGYLLHVNEDILLPLNDKADVRGIEIGNYMGIPEQFMIDGNFYALPFISDFRVVFYNKDIFDKLNEPDEDEHDLSDDSNEIDETHIASPTNEMTFDLWTEIIKEATHGSGEEKVWGNFFQNQRSATTLFGILDGRHTVNTGSYDFLIPYYEAVLELEDGRYIPRRADVVAGDVNYSDAWSLEQIAQINTGTWFMSDAIDSGFNWGLAAYPVPTSAHYGNTFGQVTQLAIPRSASYPEEAMDFIAFIIGEQGAQILASVGQIPAMITDAALDVLLDVPGFPQDDISRAALQPKTIFLEQPLSENAEKINDILDEIHNEIMDRSISIEDGITMMNEQIGALLGT